MARTDPTIYLRIPEGLKILLESAAEENRRSMTAEVVARLEQSFNPEPGQPFDIGNYEILKADILQDVLKAIEERKGKK